MGLDALALAGGLDASPEDRATRNGDRLASQGLAPVLDLEVAHAAWPAAPEPRSPGTDRSNVAGKSSVGHRERSYGMRSRASGRRTCSWFRPSASKPCMCSSSSDTSAES